MGRENSSKKGRWERIWEITKSEGSYVTLKEYDYREG